MFRHDPGLQDVHPPVPIIVPALESRAHGVLWSGAPSQRPAGLILLSEPWIDATSIQQVSTLLCSNCQTAGISVLEILHGNVRRHKEGTYPSLLVLDLL